MICRLSRRVPSAILLAGAACSARNMEPTPAPSASRLEEEAAPETEASSAAPDETSEDRVDTALPEAMPAFDRDQLPDDELQAILAWLGSAPHPTTGEGL